MTACDPMGGSMLEAALHYAGLGWPVLPLFGVRPDGNCTCGNASCGKSTGKHPHLTTGKEHEAASTDAATIRWWWKQWPDCNVGIVTGPRSGLAVLDVDGDLGLQNLARWEERIGTMPITLCSRTGSGGFHYLFRHPGGDHKVVNRAHSLGKNLDIRGNGGLFVLPPSAHRSGRAYEWITSDVELAPFDWLGRALELADAEREAAKVAPANVLPFPRPDRDLVLRRATAYLQKMSPAISGSGGHDATWKAALAVVRGFGLSLSEGYSLLASNYNATCQPPWSEKELRHKVESAAADARTPWGYLLADRPRPTRYDGPAPVPAEMPEPPAWLDEIPPLEEPRPQARPGALLDFLPATPETAKWLGSQAAKAGRTEELEAQISEPLKPAWEAGVRVGAEGAVLARPPEVTPANYQRVKRLLTKEEKPPESEAAGDCLRELGLVSVRIVRRPVMDRATVDLSLESDCGLKAELRRLSGADLGSYKTVRDRALEAALVLPSASKGAKGAWNRVLAVAMQESTVEAVDPEESIAFAIREQIREVLANTDRGDREDDLKRGKVVVHEGFAYILPKWLVSQVRLKLQDDRPERPDIIDAAASLGMRPLRPLLEKDNSRPRVWAFPWPLAEA